MRKVYSKPSIEIEVYELNAAIAANCGTRISFGPGAEERPDLEVCKEFEGAFDVVWLNPGASVFSTGHTPFYADGAANCDCYYTSGNNGYFTS